MFVICSYKYCFSAVLRYKDVRSTIPDEYDLNVYSANEAQQYSWYGGQLLSNNQNDYNQYVVTRKQYDEIGHNICKQKFDPFSQTQQSQ